MGIRVLNAYKKWRTLSNQWHHSRKRRVNKIQSKPQTGNSKEESSGKAEINEIVNKKNRESQWNQQLVLWDR